MALRTCPAQRAEFQRPLLTPCRLDHKWHDTATHAHHRAAAYESLHMHFMHMKHHMSPHALHERETSPFAALKGKRRNLSCIIYILCRHELCVYIYIL